MGHGLRAKSSGFKSQAQVVKRINILACLYVYMWLTLNENTYNTKDKERSERHQIIRAKRKIKGYLSSKSDINHEEDPSSSECGAFAPPR